MRCVQLCSGLPEATAFGCRMLGPLTRAYDDVVAPIVEDTVSDLDERARVGCALRAMSAKAGMVILSFARLAGCEQRLDVAVLASAAGRLYDDLVDGSTDTSVDGRLGDLFNARSFHACGDLEHLLAELVSEIRWTAPAKLEGLCCRHELFYRGFEARVVLFLEFFWRSIPARRVKPLLIIPGNPL
jgi:hypothetical protein